MVCHLDVGAAQGIPAAPEYSLFPFFLLEKVGLGPAGRALGPRAAIIPLAARHELPSAHEAQVALLVVVSLSVSVKSLGLTSRAFDGGVP